MYPEIVPIHRKESLREDGMLFVRTEGILETMVKAPLIIAGLMVVALTMPLQTSFSSTRMLDLTLYSDGSAHISAQLDADPLDPDFEVSLFGPSIDNFVAVGENGFLLSSEIIDGTATIDTFGSSSITIDYDIHDLISKEGRVWTFTLDSPTDYSLLMPPNSIIVGMDALPSNMDLVNDQTQLDLSSGLSEINYIFSTTTTPPTTTPPTTTPPTTTPPTTTPVQPTNDVVTYALIGAPVAAAIAGAVIMIKRKQTKSSPVIQTEVTTESQTKTDSSDTETIFNLRPEMREDDKEIIKFISANGGEALESDLRKKFLQPRTTMWRAVKRLERQGVIEISKKDLQNLVKLKKDLEEEE
ncbi:MarR family transcriptional regulator [Nitrosopumilus cobalaminigenes]|uniref:MarR family transcriptional regulator n=1 Tax=Nitrosopumilus cobalaminigenes TaxID=1470066 RepID=A0A7D5LYK8_9ARCH|nr:MarR family transcriptional regulator [Nitrosopumilus cobalaminigenes]QLH02112.1 MarR family transcriptional regulator [Nitrosopumilus cobalaminigenes]